LFGRLDKWWKKEIYCLGPTQKIFSMFKENWRNMNFVIFIFIFFFLLPIRLKLTIRISILLSTQFSIHPNNNMQSIPTTCNLDLIYQFLFSLLFSPLKQSVQEKEEWVNSSIYLPSSPILHHQSYMNQGSSSPVLSILLKNIHKYVKYNHPFSNTIPIFILL